mmetsp:Transcript_11646/g.28557  ORF Transcript_11646/g.28557 Transcript_11646/m.28557 type:complete len:213 (-) Transcript_11646:119-757(-)
MAMCERASTAAPNAQRVPSSMPGKATAPNAGRSTHPVTSNTPRAQMDTSQSHSRCAGASFRSRRATLTWSPRSRDPPALTRTTRSTSSWMAATKSARLVTSRAPSSGRCASLCVGPPTARLASVSASSQASPAWTLEALGRRWVLGVHARTRRRLQRTLGLRGAGALWRRHCMLLAPAMTARWVLRMTRRHSRRGRVISWLRSAAMCWRVVV